MSTPSDSYGHSRGGIRSLGARLRAATAVSLAAIALLLATDPAEACSVCETKDKRNSEAQSGFDACTFVPVTRSKRTRVGIWRWLLGGAHDVDMEYVCQPAGETCHEVKNPVGGDIDPEVDPDDGEQPDHPVGGGLG